MFSKKMAKDEVGAPTQLKGSKQRALKDKVLETYPLISDVIDAILPKKKDMTVSKCPNCVELYCIDGVQVARGHLKSKGESTWKVKQNGC